MKRRPQDEKSLIMTCALLAAILCATAGIAADIGLDVDPPGYFVCEFPEQPRMDGTSYDEYMLTWKPRSDIHQYQINVIAFISMKIDGRDTYAIAPATGFVSENAIVKDGMGKEYKVPFAIIDSMVIEGTCEQVDISALLGSVNSFL